MLNHDNCRNSRTAKHFLRYFILLVCCIVVGFATQASAQPRITTSEPIYQFGTALNTEVVTNDFTIQNTGDQVLIIQGIQTSCGCSAAHPEKDQLEPGESTTISANFDLKNRYGPQTTSFTVRSNDPQTSALRLQFRGEALAPINIEPRSVNFRQVMLGGESVEKVRVTSMLPELFFNIERIVNPIDALTVDYEMLESGKEYELTLSVKENAPEGTFNNNISIHTGSAEYPVVTLRVAGQVMGDIVIVPTHLRIPYNDDSEKTTNQYIRVSPGKVVDFEVVEVVPPSPDMGVEIREQRGDAYIIRIMDIPVDGSMDGQDILIYTDIPGNTEFRVPIQNPKP